MKQYYRNRATSSCEGGWRFEEVMKLSSGCRCWGKWNEGQQGAEKEDELPAAAADSSSRLAGRTAERRVFGQAILSYTAPQ